MNPLLFAQVDAPAAAGDLKGWLLGMATLLGSMILGRFVQGWRSGAGIKQAVLSIWLGTNAPRPPKTGASNPRPPQEPGGARMELIGLMGLITAGVLLTACTASKLAPGGDYAPATTLFVADKAFELAYRTLDTAFQIERDNRALFWNISPEIKRGLDRVRVDAVKIKRQWATARQTYTALPTPDNLKTLQGALAEIQRLAATAGAVLANSATPKAAIP